MATTTEKLALSLEALRALQKKGDSVIKANQLSRTNRERLLSNGFIKSVLKGWYIPSRPDESTGDSTSWTASYWNFCGVYLNDRFGKNWWLSAEQSIALHAGNWVIPHQLIVKSSNGKNNKTNLLFDTSIFDMKTPLTDDIEVEVIDNVRVLSLSMAIIHCSPSTFSQSPIEMRTALAQVKDASDLLTTLLNKGHSVIAGRLAGAFRNIGNVRIANDIMSAMKAADYDVREHDPFKEISPPIFDSMEKSPYVNRIRMLWHEMRKEVLPHLPEPKGLPKNKTEFLKQIDDLFVTDAYHSLSIEGYQVSEELIEKVRSGSWSPETDERDLEQKNAMAARGYYEAFQSVKQSIEKIINGQNPAEVVDYDHGEWYRALFAPSVASGLVKPSDLAGYRNRPVYIKNSKHVPLSKEAVRDTMPALFDLLANEENVAVRAVLGHFIFVYIHPYIDGNGRIARFLMNTMLTSGGYPWTIIKVDDRKKYMEAIESASVDKDIQPFAEFVGEAVKASMNRAYL